MMVRPQEVKYFNRRKIMTIENFGSSEIELIEKNFRRQVGVSGVSGFSGINGNIITPGNTGGSGSAGSGKQFVTLTIGSIEYKLLHDGIVTGD
jgi:hypothetical protein